MFIICLLNIKYSISCVWPVLAYNAGYEGTKWQLIFIVLLMRSFSPKCISNKQIYVVDQNTCGSIKTFKAIRAVLPDLRRADKVKSMANIPPVNTKWNKGSDNTLFFFSSFCTGPLNRKKNKHCHLDEAKICYKHNRKINIGHSVNLHT